MPTYEPTSEPSYTPSQSPTQSPIVGTRSPTVFPSVSPSLSKHPTFTPSNSPTTSMLDGPIRTTGLTLTLFGLDFINETEWEQITSNSFSEFYTSGPDLDGARAEVSITDIKWDPGSLLGRRRMNGGIRENRFLQSESSMKVVYAQELYYSSRKPTSTSSNSQLATYPLSTTSNRESYYIELGSLPGYEDLISVSGISLPYDAPLFNSPPAETSNVGPIVGGLFAVIIIGALVVYVYQLKLSKTGMKSVGEDDVLPNVDNSRRVEDYSQTYGVGEIRSSSFIPGDQSDVTYGYGYKYAQQIDEDTTMFNLEQIPEAMKEDLSIHSAPGSIALNAKTPKKYDDDNDSIEVSVDGFIGDVLTTCDAAPATVQLSDSTIGLASETVDWAQETIASPDASDDIVKSAMAAMKRAQMILDGHEYTKETENI